MSSRRTVLLLAVLTLILATIAALDTALGAAQAPARGESRDGWYADGRAALDAALRLQPEGDRARNVILFVGDGMGISTVTAARILEGQRRGAPGEEHSLSFERLPYLALSKTYSVNQQVADSAPTMTAMVTGVKTNDSALSVDQHTSRDDHATVAGHELTTLLELAEDAGLSTGLVSAYLFRGIIEQNVIFHVMAHALRLGR